ncbi:unnamed protein product [Linum tenue]|uniref:Uncharacterized protein n=1 Tax=Linum tenue TaxID=586396 RepID=A0AAV0HKB3_9ROSI|nr:unnamed protein product [Linum tenue]
METSYLQDPSQCGNVLKGFEGFLSSSKNTALYGATVYITVSLHLPTTCLYLSQFYSFLFSLQF